MGASPASRPRAGSLCGYDGRSPRLPEFPAWRVGAYGNDDGQQFCICLADRRGAGRRGRLRAGGCRRRLWCPTRIRFCRRRRTISRSRQTMTERSPPTTRRNMTSPRRGTPPRPARAILARPAAPPAIRCACSCATSATPNCSRASRRSRWRSGWRRARRRRWRRCASARRPSPRSPRGAMRCRTAASGCATSSSLDGTRRDRRPAGAPEEAPDPALEEGLRPETLARLDAILAANAALRAARQAPAEAYQAQLARDGRRDAAPWAAPQPDRSADRRAEGGVRPAGGARPGGDGLALAAGLQRAAFLKLWDGSAASVARVERAGRWRRSARRCVPGWPESGLKSSNWRSRPACRSPNCAACCTTSAGASVRRVTPGTP